jgi:Flp pilus assembly protein TadD/glutathione synthase/RimK-type ligase-like ATP-grasp enzyme
MNHGARALPAAVGTELVTLFNAGKWPQLASAARRVTARYPRHLLGWRALGKALLMSGKTRDAVDVLSRVVTLAPREADAHNDLGLALCAQARQPEAEASYRRAVDLDPRLAEAHCNLGNLLNELRRFDEAAECHRHAVALDPASAAYRNNLGNALRALGALDEAEACYRGAIALKPDYVDALTNLGVILELQANWGAAKEVLRLALRRDPDARSALKALGRLLGRLTGDDDEAVRCLERAVALEADDPDTHVELGNILMRQHAVDAALTRFRYAQALRPLITWRAEQARADFSVLFLDTPVAGSTPVSYLAGRARYDRHFHCVLPDGHADIDMLRAKADVVFNMICNADDGAAILPQALDLVDRIGRPTVNHPRLVMSTDRATMARRLEDIPGCVVPRTARASGVELAEAAARGAFEQFGLPVLVRPAGTHGGRDFEKFDDWAAVAAFVSARPQDEYYVIEYLDYRSPDGLFRKYRIILIDDEILPYHLAIHDHWMVHYYKTEMASHAWMREEEERFLRDIASVFGPAQREALRAVGVATGLDYSGVDCGVDRDGAVVVFEANAAMLVHDEKDKTFAYKNQYIHRIKDAFDAMLSRRLTAGQRLR